MIEQFLLQDGAYVQRRAVEKQRFIPETRRYPVDHALIGMRDALPQPIPRGVKFVQRGGDVQHDGREVFALRSGLIAPARKNGESLDQHGQGHVKVFPGDFQPRQTG